MTDLKKYNVDESIPMLMSTCVKYMRETLNARFMEAGSSISTEQWMILMYLGRQDGISQQNLADNYGISKVSALNLIRKLEKQSLIVRHPDPIDGRSNRVYLTAEGRKVQTSLIPLANQNIAQMSEGIVSEDVEVLKRTIRKMVKNLNR